MADQKLSLLDGLFAEAGRAGGGAVKAAVEAAKSEISNKGAIARELVTGAIKGDSKAAVADEALPGPELPSPGRVGIALALFALAVGIVVKYWPKGD